MPARLARSARSPSVSPARTGSCWLLAAGGPQFRRRVWFFLLGCPKALARSRELDRDALDVARETVERGAQAQVFAQPLVAAGLAQSRNRLVEVVVEFLDLLAHDRVDVVVGDGDVGLVRNRFEHDLARDGQRRLGMQRVDELLWSAPAQREVLLEREAAPLDAARQPVQQLARAHLDEWPVRVHACRAYERVHGRTPELPFELGRDLLAQIVLEIRTQLDERIELAHLPREVVVQRRQHLLVDLLDLRLDGAGLALGDGNLDGR